MHNQLLAIRAFVRVAEAGSFTKAADRLSLPRSTVSKLIADLEAHLGVRLIQRTTRTAALTIEGTDYLASVAPLVLELEDADARVRGKRLNPQGRLRVDVTSSFANLFLIERLPDFRRRFPDLVLELGISDRTIDMVGEGVDCAIRVGELPDSSLMARHLFTAPTALCASPDYLSRRGRPQSPDQLRGDHDLVGYFVSATSRPLPIMLGPIMLGDGPNREEFTAFAMMANDSTGHIAMMSAGLGIGQNIRLFMQDRINTGELEELLPYWPQPQMPFHILYPPNRHKSVRLNVFIDWVVDQTKDLKHLC